MIFNQPFCAHPSIEAPGYRVCSGNPSAAMDWAVRHSDGSSQRSRARRESSSINAAISLGPSAQLCDAEQGHRGNGIPERFYRLARHPAIAAGLNKRHRAMRGALLWRSSKNLSMAKNAAFALSVSKMVSTNKRSTHTVDQSTDLLVVDRHSSSRFGAARRRLLTSVEIDDVFVVGPIAPPPARPSRRCNV